MRRLFLTILFILAMTSSVISQTIQNPLTLKDDKTAATVTINLTSGAFVFYNPVSDDQYIGTINGAPYTVRGCAFTVSHTDVAGGFNFDLTADLCTTIGSFTLADLIYGSRYVLTDTNGTQLSPTPTPTPLPNATVCYADSDGNGTFLNVNLGTGEYDFAKCGKKVAKATVYKVWSHGVATIKRKGDKLNISIAGPDLNGVLQVIGKKASGAFFDKNGTRQLLTVADTTKNITCGCPVTVAKAGVRRQRCK